MAVSYEQVAGSMLYQVAPDTTRGWCGYILPAGDTGPPASLSPNDALDTWPGTFVFAPDAPGFTTTDQANAFATAVMTWLTQPGQSFSGRFCVWMPRADPVTFGSGPYYVDPNGSTYAVRFSPQGGNWTVQQNLNVRMGSDASLALTTSVLISATADGDGLGLWSPLAGGMTVVLPSLGPVLEIPSQRAVLRLVGDRAGCIVLGGTLQLPARMSGYLVGMQFAYGQANGAGDVVQGFPLLDTGGGVSLAVVGSFDPLDPYCLGAHSSQEAGLYRTGIAADLAGGVVTLPSWYRTSANLPVSLLPQGGGTATGGPVAHAGGFIFQPATALAYGTDGRPRLAPTYLAPVGDHAVSAAAGAVTLLCGLNGTEILRMQPAGGEGAADLLRFSGPQPAYTPCYPPPVASLAVPSSGQRTPALPLPLSYVASYVEVVTGGGTAPAYSAQPQGSTLFGPGGPDASGAAVAGVLQPLVPVAGALFPMPPWAGLGATAAIPVAIWGDYESRVLAAARRDAIQRLARGSLEVLKRSRSAKTSMDAATAPPSVTANGTTPQGLLAQLGGGDGVTTYDAVVLAQSDGSGTPGSQMAFFDLDAALQGLFQTSQLFAVIADPTHLGTFANSVDIAGWTMQADVGAGSATSNVSNLLVLKFCNGTLADLAARPSAWVDTDDFSKPDPSTGVAVLSQALQDTIAQATALARSGNTLYARFAAIAADPSWQGILVLGATVGVSDLPPQLAGLSAGIDASQFRAHHFGVTVSPVRYDGTSLSIPGRSSFFALIDYQLPQFARSVAAGAGPSQPLALPGEGVYGFTVLQLQVLFENSVVTDFRSHVQVTLNRLYGSTVTASYAAGARLAANSVVLTGTYQEQGGLGTYLFESTGTTVMVTDSNVLDSVVLTKLMFNTLTSDDGSAAHRFLSRILIWGAFNFTVLPASDGSAFDLMSYGMPAGTDPSLATGGLAFSNLSLDMASPGATPTMVTYGMVEDSIAFDLAGSIPRAGSAVAGLALQPQRLVVASAGATPASKGYLPVRLDQGAPPQVAVSGDWYGIAAQVNMGGPGALASAAGFTSQMLLGWSPQTRRGAKGYAAFGGLQLPGANPGASSFSLQGVLRLTVGTISLSLAPVAGSGGDAFTLRLSNIALSFLGVASLPPGASIDMYLFGAPASQDGRSGQGSLGWYAAWVETPPTAAPAQLS